MSGRFSNGALRVGPQAIIALLARVPQWLWPRAVILVVLAALIYTGALDPLERLLSDWRFKTAARPASQSLVVVEIDSSSLHKLNTWPWPRGYYAEAIANLRAAGARNIGIDVDFSSRAADAAEDAKLARAIADAGGSVILPVFMQPTRTAGGGLGLVEVRPNDRLLQGALLANVNLQPEADGVLRKGHFGVTSASGLRASMAAALAGEATTRTDAYYIDFGITLRSMPRLSFADVMANKFDARLVAGRNIIIGSTALELGDEFAVPVHAIASGVDLHALSYESIVQHRTLVRPSLLFTLILALLVVAILGREQKEWSWLSVLAPHAVVLALAFGAPLTVQLIAPVSIDATPVLAAQLLCFMLTVSAELERRARDLFQQRALNARQNALVALAVKDSTDGIIVTDAQGRIELCNERAATLLDLSNPAAAAGAVLTSLVADFPEYPTERAPGGKDARVPSDCFPVIQEWQRDNQIFEVSSDWTLCEDQGIKNVAGGYIYVHTLRDVSARKRTEEAERQAKEALIAASQARSQFIHAMSHELRTPLNAVIGFSEMMRGETMGPIGHPTYAEYIGMIHEGGKHLLSVVNDVLDVTRLESGDVKAEKEPVGLRGLVLGLVEDRRIDQDRRVRVDIAPELKANVDRRLFGLALQHLLSNAQKFSRDDGRIDVAARVEGEGTVVIEVRDDGVGIEPEELPKLTQAFYQGDPSLSRTHGGTGLGLFLVTKYLELHEGTLELESQKGEGFLARIRLPAALASTAPPKPLRAVA